MVSEAIFPTNRGYICIEKWSQIFVSGIGSAHSESEEKTLFQLKKDDKLGNIRGRTTSKNTTCVIAGGGRKEFFVTLQLESLDSS